MNSKIKGLNSCYKKMLEKVQSIQKEELYSLGYGIGDLPYFLDGEQLENEKRIHSKIEKADNELAELLEQSIRD